MLIGIPWLITWKKPQFSQAILSCAMMLAWSLGSISKPCMSMTGMLKLGSSEPDISSSRAGRSWWMNMRGILVTPESTSPFTPAFVSSKFFSSLSQSESCLLPVRIWPSICSFPRKIWRISLLKALILKSMNLYVQKLRINWWKNSIPVPNRKTN